MKFVWLDFEGASAADLEKGAYHYFEHPTTHFTCIGFFTNLYGLRQIKFHGDLAILDQDVELLRALAADPEYIFVAHNAHFERVGWQKIMVERLGFPPIPVHRWKCTMAKALAHGLPGGLGDLADALGLESRKLDNKQLKALFRPKEDGTFWQYIEAPELFEQMYEYNAQDILTMREADLYLRDLIPSEQRLWEINERMNENGIQLDMPLVHRALEFIGYYSATENLRFYQITGLPRPSLRERFGYWLEAKGYPMPRTPKGKPDTSKDTIRKLLPLIQQPDVKEAVLLFQAAAKSSLTKYETMVELATEGGLLREILAYYAAHTGRYGGRGVQLQNLPRPIVDIHNAVQSILYDYETFRWFYEAA